MADQAPETDTPMTVPELFEALGEAIDFTALPVGSAALWFGPGGSPVFIRLNEPIGFDVFSRAIAIFQTETTIIVYALPAKKPDDWDPKSVWKTRPPLRITLTKIAPTYFQEEMPLEVMLDELTEEWNGVAGQSRTPDAELEEVLEHIRSLDAVLSRDELLKDLEAGVHHGVPDEPEPEAPVPNGASPTEPAPSITPLG